MVNNSIRIGRVHWNNRCIDTARWEIQTRKSALEFFSNTRQSGDWEYVCAYIFFYSRSLFPDLSPLSTTSTERDRDALFPPRCDRSICFAAGIACLAATSFLSHRLYLSASSVSLPHSPFPLSLSVILTLHGRFEQWTNRLDVISTYPLVYV